MNQMNPRNSMNPMNRQSDVMTRLGDARPAHLDRAPVPGRRQDDLSRALGEPTRRSDGPNRIRVRPTRIAVGLGAVAAVAAVTVASTGSIGFFGPEARPRAGSPTSGSAAPSSGLTTPSQNSTVPNSGSALGASQILLVAADQVRSDSTSGRYWRITHDLYALELAGPAKSPYVIRSGDREQTWIARSDSKPSWAAHKGLGRAPLSAADRAAWKRDGSPTTFAVRGDRVTGSGKQKDSIAQIPGAPSSWTVDMFNPASKVFFVGHDLTMQDVRALPSDEAALRDFLLTDFRRNVEASRQRGESLAQDDWLFSQATELLTLPVASEVRASAYRIMAGIKGVRSLGQVKDAAGRVGNAVAVTGTDSRGRFENRIIINSSTGLLMADETRILEPVAALSWVKPTDVYASTVVKQIGWTNDKPPAATKYDASGSGLG